MTSYLLDSHVLVWWLSDDPMLSKEGRKLIAAAASTIFVSVVSFWELRIKESLGKIRLPKDFLSTAVEDGFLELPLEFRHLAGLQSLGTHHKDPFDRVLIAQANVDDLVIVSHDPVFEKYSVRLRLV